MERLARDSARQSMAWLILIAAQMIMPHSAKLTCNASTMADLARIPATALLDLSDLLLMESAITPTRRAGW